MFDNDFSASLCAIIILSAVVNLGFLSTPNRCALSISFAIFLLLNDVTLAKFTTILNLTHADTLILKQTLNENCYSQNMLAHRFSV